MLKEKDAQSQFLKEESDSNWLQEKAKMPKILRNSFVKNVDQWFTKDYTMNICLSISNYVQHIESMEGFFKNCFIETILDMSYFSCIFVPCFLKNVITYMTSYFPLASREVSKL